MVKKKLREAVKSTRILIIDDQEFNVILLTKLLKEIGFNIVSSACNGIEALEKTKEFLPDLIILDLVMPKMDGYEFCRKIRQIPEFENIPILVQTILGSKVEKVRAFECGASDYITKPFDTDELIARTLVHAERHHLYMSLKISQERIAHELMSARDMQMTLLPTKELIANISVVHHMDIASCFQPSYELGGDIWGCRSLSENELAVYIADFSGHGVSAALNTFRLHTLIETHSQKDTDPGTYLTNLNNNLRNLLNRGQFATMFYGIINHKTEMMSYATAAAPNPLLLTPEYPNITLLDGSGFPLGVVDNITYETKTVSFHPDSMLMIYSDALIETEDSEGRFFDEAEMALSINNSYLSSTDRSAKMIYSSLMNHFNHKYIQQLKDDLTIVLLHQKR